METTIKPKPKLREGAHGGWYCCGSGIEIFASTPEDAYEAWRFVAYGGYTSVYGREHGDYSRGEYHVWREPDGHGGER